MNYEPNTSLNLSLPYSCMTNQVINLNPNSSPNISCNLSQPSSPIEPRVFSCNYCRRKFYSSQALGGHQNAHKLERTLAKKSREFSSVIRPHLGHINLDSGRVSGSPVELDHRYDHAGRFGRREISFAHNWNIIPNEFIIGVEGHVLDQEELGQLDLSLRL